MPVVYILIWVVVGTTSGGGIPNAVVTRSQEFSSLDTCEYAKLTLLTWKGDFTINAQCFKK